MRTSQKNRCARVMVRDFLVGLAVFLAVFTLAMLDSRASRSAPAVDSKPATIAQIESVSPANMSSGALSLQLPGDANSFSRWRKFHTNIEQRTGRISKLALNDGRLQAGRLAAPGTQGTADRSWKITIMALIFAAMTTLTLGLWRHLRQSVAPRRSERRV